MKVQHLHAQCLEQTLGILYELKEAAQGSESLRFNRAYTALGAALRYDVEPEIILTRPVLWRQKVRRIAIEGGPIKD